MKREIGDYMEDIIGAMKAATEFTNDIDYDDLLGILKQSIQ